MELASTAMVSMSTDSNNNVQTKGMVYSEITGFVLILPKQSVTTFFLFLR